MKSITQLFLEYIVHKNIKIKIKDLPYHLRLRIKRERIISKIHSFMNMIEVAMCNTFDKIRKYEIDSGYISDESPNQGKLKTLSIFGSDFSLRDIPTSFDKLRLRTDNNKIPCLHLQRRAEVIYDIWFNQFLKMSEIDRNIIFLFLS